MKGFHLQAEFQYVFSPSEFFLLCQVEKQDKDVAGCLVANGPIPGFGELEKVSPLFLIEGSSPASLRTLYFGNELS